MDLEILLTGIENIIAFDWTRLERPKAPAIPRDAATSVAEEKLEFVTR